MTADELKAARKSLGLKQHEIAPLLGFGHSVRVSELERGATAISAAVERLVRAYLDGYRPNDWPQKTNG
ncbi:hypothetical protein [Paracoccus sp. (in: a-proteobacteria)]|uniref:hypothetical protein n=1 Tax=Paracoccus sp. TaxID=267 RepID=UPI0026DF772F|nr:hypothetical protein [Paracoccus sp. (in: a-proteobacteria)]MDO5648348.1 hypothetical protein [Paracoccus sp. (in: a-proteobacteria)]